MEKQKHVVLVRMRYKKIFVTILVFVMAVVFSYYWGYLCAKKENNYREYDDANIRLANSIVMLDAVSLKKNDVANKFILLNLESDFELMVSLYEANGYQGNEYMRCVVSRRIRSLKEKKLIFVDDVPWGVSLYLDKECMGKPSHENWMQLE